MALAPVVPCTGCIFLLFQWLLLALTMAETHREISLGSSLSTNDNHNMFWESHSGEFAFGFQQVGKGGFLLAIWFNNIPEKTIVWSANGNTLAKQGSKLELTNNGLLVLKTPEGKQMWVSQGVAGSGSKVAHAAMLDTGNFVLADQNSINLWESFGEPTDTLLPLQTLSQGKKLVARYSDTNFSKGRFQLMLQPSGTLEFYTTTFPLDAANYVYWSSKPVSGFQLVFNQSGSIYLQAKNGEILSVLSSKPCTTQDFYQRVILEYDGVFRHYVYPKNDGPETIGWSKEWTHCSPSIPSNICTSIREDTGGGACGFNSYCSLENEQRPTCNCPNGYSFIDQNDVMKGCQPNFEAQSCDQESEDEENFNFNIMENTDWPLSDYEHFQFVDENWCRKACLGDCFCAVAIFRNGECWKKKTPLSNGKFDPNDEGKALIKVRIDNSTSDHPHKKNDSILVVIASLLFGSPVFLINVLVLIPTLVVLLHLYRKAKVSKQTQFMPGMNLQSFTYAELEEATSGFKEELGRGAFAIVFKGVLPLDDGNLVAVKKLDNIVREGEQEFKAEVNAIGRTNHKNLVQLIGFCNEEQHRLLVYEFMSNGSLANFLFGSSSRPSWYQRKQIALGIARGLFYLHEECSNQIIHCDIKPHNVLLDDFFTARIADFGLAKLLKTEQTRTMTALRGTKGYVAPEWFRNLPVSVKVDVYSYGIMLLEIICCRKNFEQEIEEDQMVLADWAYDCYRDDQLSLLLKNDHEAMSDMGKVEKYVMVAIWCIQEDPSLRPTMKKVTQMLEGTVEVSIPPDPYSFISSL
ncbi:G-type lectin S-receptor-like serine/threonine-protein kinase LECRK3 [Humulus lupulus]|uniref:G-type lectin S-receptor-like serine/threonine-protein kinase LECRK3 n=1 Tax=Humulus lupulus TaxID=3486 RepID=UPI002B405012|nr:G-type lectin S-receptor-like serine/threonine-protein kinase LECRK3 [Humulus lupulus]